MKRRRQRREIHEFSTMTRSIQYVTLFLIGIFQVKAQQPAFTRQVTCPQNPNITGYTTINAMNLDMQDELTRIAKGGARPPGGYIMNLCPGIFDATSGPLTPILDGVVFTCGGPNSPPGALCEINGSAQQVNIGDSTIPGYAINSITFQGITFNGFSRGYSINMQASSPTVVTFQNCVWQVRVLLLMMIDLQAQERKKSSSIPKFVYSFRILVVPHQ